MFEKWKRELENLERTKGDILSQKVSETFKVNPHNMKVDKDLSAIYENLEDLTRADLIDYQEIERKYGRTNKTR